MKKLFALLFFCVSFCYAEDLTGVMGIKFGSSFEKVSKIMSEDGWTTEGLEVDEDNKKLTSCFFEKEGGTYCGISVNFISFNFYKNKMYRTMICFNKGRNDINNTNTEESVDILLKSLEKKYNLDKPSVKDLHGMIWCKYTANNKNTIFFERMDEPLDKSIGGLIFTDEKIVDLRAKDEEEEENNRFSAFFDKIKDKL